MKLDMKRPEHHAMVHQAIGALNALEADPPPGRYDLGGKELNLKMPDLAVVVRADGTLGDGFDEVATPEPAVSCNLVLIVLELMGIEPSEKVWMDARRDELKGKVAKAPAAAATALATVQAEQPPAEPRKRRTPAKRTGEKEVEFTIKNRKKASAPAKT